jgi:ATP-dependent DNA helicase RecG
MRSIVNINNGFELSEIDLEIRGPGAIYGYRQHGALDLRMAKLTDVKLIAAVRNSIQYVTQQGEDMLKYKEIAEKVRRVSRLTYLN